MSPIKGLSERRRLPRLGKIHLGVKALSPKGVEYPKAVDYFVAPPEVVAIYGEKPKSLEVVFPIEAADKPIAEQPFVSQFYRAYSRTRGLVCRGDGDIAVRLIDVGTKRAEPGTGVVTGDIASHTSQQVEWVEDITCPGPACSYYQAKQCREIMNLQFLLPRVPGFGVWQLDTSSYNSILNINSALELVRGAFHTVAGIPLLLTVEPTEVSPDGKKKTVWVLQLRSKSTLAQLAEARSRPLHALLPPGDDDVPELLFPSEAAQNAQREAEVPSAEQVNQNTGAAPETKPQAPLPGQDQPIPQSPDKSGQSGTPKQSPSSGSSPVPQGAAPKPELVWELMPRCWAAVGALGGKPLDFLNFLGVKRFDDIKDVGKALAEYAKALGKPAPEWED